MVDEEAGSSLTLKFQPADLAYALNPFNAWHKNFPFSRQNDIERSALNLLYSLIISQPRTLLK